MKKILFAAMAAIFACGLNAENAVRVRITSPENSRTDYVYIQEDASFSATSQDTEEASKFMNTAPNLNIYAVVPYGNMAILNTNDVEGVVLAFTTNSKTNYKLSFDMQEGNVFYVVDAVTEKYIQMVNGGSYAFTAEANQTIADRFSIAKNIPATFINNRLVITDAAAGAEVNVTPFSFVEGRRVDGTKVTYNAPVNQALNGDYFEVEYTNKNGVARKFIVNANPDVLPAND